MRSAFAFVCLLAATACGDGPTAPTVTLAAEFVLAPGEAAAVEGTPLTIRFFGVRGDSRCPADVVCIQGGSADVFVTVRSDDGVRDYVLRTGDMQPVRHDSYTIALVALTPYPFSSRTIRSDEYRATLRVTR
jgi:hypothetical protein